jgi:hypothetical protein
MVLIFNATGGYKTSWFSTLASTKYASQSTRDSCKYMIVDCDIHNPKMTTEFVVQKASELSPPANCIVIKDYVHNWVETVSSVKEFYRKDMYGWKGDVLIPLQPSYSKCYAELREYGNYFGLGGLRFIKNLDEQFKVATRGIRLLHKESKQIHLFGIFPSPSTYFYHYIKRNKDFIYSLDSTVQEIGACVGMVYDPLLRRIHLLATKGAWSRKFREEIARLSLASTFLAMNGNLQYLPDNGNYEDDFVKLWQVYCNELSDGNIIIDFNCDQYLIRGNLPREYIKYLFDFNLRAIYIINHRPKTSIKERKSICFQNLKH